MPLKKKKIISVFFLSIGFLLGSILLVDYYVQIQTKEKLYSQLDTIPKNRVGLLLGTIKTLQSGYPNYYYIYRIEAASQLFHAGKIDYILVSGDNSRKGYDEPTDMKEDLIKKGVPEHKIVLDYAGFRTLDSVVRSNKIFGQKKLTIISQKFHNERAVFIAQYKGIDAIGFQAKDVSTRAGLKVQIRERFARVKMLLDLFLGVQPKFLGKKIKL